jgi:hypothetical protein
MTRAVSEFYRLLEGATRPGLKVFERIAITGAAEGKYDARTQSDTRKLACFRT